MIETLNRDRRSFIAGEKIMSHFPFRGSPPHLTQVCTQTTFKSNSDVHFTEIVVQFNSEVPVRKKS